MKQCNKLAIWFFLMILVIFICAPGFGESTEEWRDVKGVYNKVKAEAGRNETLSLMYLDNDVVMFEFLMTESEMAETIGNNYCLASAFYIDENGVGLYEHPKTGDVKINFIFTKDSVEVQQIGELPFNVSGVYALSEQALEVSEQAAVEILEQLPPAATSLNQYNRPYELVMSNERVDGWFYDVKARIIGAEETFAAFYIAADMSAVYRVDAETPMLIWGSAQSLLDGSYTMSSDVYSDGEPAPVEADYVVVMLETDAIAAGQSEKIVVKIPGNLQYSIQFESSNSDHVKVDAAGTITVLETVECAISGTIGIDGAEKSFELMVNPDNQKTEMNNVKKAIDLKILIGIVLFVTGAVVVLIILVYKKKKNTKR